MALRIFVVCFAFLMSALPVFGTAAFAGDPYTVSNVHVDAQADNALEAQTLAISEGYVKAANILISRLSLERERMAKGFAGVSEIDSKKMIRAQGTNDEKRSSTRYIADITVSFNPRAVSQYMRVHGLTLVASQARPRLVIPMINGYPVWDENEWTTAWADGRFGNALTPIQVITPKPGLEPILNAIGRDGLKTFDLKIIGKAYGVEQILIATVQDRYGLYAVSLNDIALDTGQQRDLGVVTNASIVSVVEASVASLENDWKASTVTPISTQSVIMPISVLYRNHAEWQRLQDVINGTAQIRGAKLEALSKSGAMMMITYGGDIERLRNELSFKGVSLQSDEKLGMVLYRTGAY